MLHHLAGPDLLHRDHVVVEARAAALEGNPEGFELLPQPADAHAQHEPSVRHEVEARGLLGHVEGIHLGEDVHPGAETQGAGGTGHRGQGHQRVHHGGFRFGAHLAAGVVGILRLVIHRHDHVLEGPYGFVTGRFGELGERDHLRGILDADVHGNETDLHVLSLVCPRGDSLVCPRGDGILARGIGGRKLTPRVVPVSRDAR